MIQTHIFYVLKYQEIEGRNWKKNGFKSGGQLKSMINQVGEDGLFLGRADDHLINNTDWSYLSNIADNLFKMIKQPAINQSSTSSNNTFNISMEFPDVTDYKDFINKLQSDKRFEKIIQSMTIEKVMGGNSLAKNRFKR